MAKPSNKMIQVGVYFWTDKLPDKGSHAWTSGMVRVNANKRHGIHAHRARPFNSLLGLTAAIEKTLKDNGVVLHISRGEKYLKGQG